MASSSSTRAALVNVTVENANALDCGICFLPLKPPIFHCRFGHVLCSPCRDKTADADKCHVCRTPTGKAGYLRNHDMEKLLESIRVPCRKAAHGCTDTPVYFDHAEHLKACPHTRCLCPGEVRLRGFAGSTAALLDHFAAVHEWPCTTGLQSWKCLDVHLRHGFNAVCARAAGQQYLFLLNVVRDAFGHAVTAFCLRPQQAADDSSRMPPSRTLEFEISPKYSSNAYDPSDICRGHCQETKFKVLPADLSLGLPDSENCFQFFLPKSVHPHDMDVIAVKFDVVNVTAQG